MAPPPTPPQRRWRPARTRATALVAAAAAAAAAAALLSHLPGAAAQARFAKYLPGLLSPKPFNDTGLAFGGCDMAHGCELWFYDLYNEPYMVAVSHERAA
jgi:hypothetical protein